MGNHILEQAKLITVDDRLPANADMDHCVRVTGSIYVPTKSKQVDVPQPTTILSSYRDVKLTGLTSKEVSLFKSNITYNKIQIPSYVFDRKLLSNNMQIRLKNLWNTKGSSNSKDWMTIPDDEFFKFLEELTNDSIGSRKDSSTIEDINRKLIKGLFFNPLKLVETLDQIAIFEEWLLDNDISCTLGQLKHFDNLTFDNLKYQSCSENIKPWAQAIKTGLVYPSGKLPEPFHFFRHLVRETGSVIEQSMGILDVVNITDFAAKYRPTLPKSKPKKEVNHNPFSTSNTHVSRKRNNPPPASSEKDESPKTYCSACGMKGHSYDQCSKVTDLSIDRSLLNLNKSIAFAESERGKYLVNQGYPAWYHKDKVVPKKDPPTAVHGQPNSNKRRKVGFKDNKRTLCYFSTINDIDLPLINTVVSSQASLGSQDISCLLDTGADVDYVDSKLIVAMRASKFIINCNNCSTCSGVHSNCHAIAGIINLSVSFTNELNQQYTIMVKAHIVDNLNHKLIIGLKTIRKHNLILQFPKHFIDLQSIPRYWDFQVGRGCGITTAAVLGRDTIDVRNVVDSSATEEIPHSLCVECSSLVSDFQSNRKPHKEEIVPGNQPNTNLASDSSPYTPPFFNSRSTVLNSLNRSIRSDYDREDIEEIRDDQMEAIPSVMLDPTNENDELPTNIHGSPELQAKLRSLVTR